MKLTISVIVVHLFLFILFVYFPVPSKKPLSHPRAEVRTLLIKENSPEKNTPEKTVPVKKQSKKARTKTPSLKRKKLLDLMQESLNTLEKEAPVSAARPIPIGKLSSEQLRFETSYEEGLITYLEQLLEFPERGLVTLSLTLARSGVVQTVAIHSATSEKNRSYLVSTLPTLLLPEFGNQFKGEENHTFLLTLTSEK